MDRDPYDILGVNKDASQEDIQKTYRRLAKKLHPDLNPGNTKAEEEFKDVASAYALLGDPEKRKRFDNGEIDGQGAEQKRKPYFRDYADNDANPYASGSGFSDFEGAEDILSEIFGRRGSAGHSGFKTRGADVHYRMSVDFLDAVNGAQKQLALAEGTPLDITIPPGVRDGQLLRLRGKGRPGLDGGPPGDTLIEVDIRPHAIFTRQGDDIHLDLAISLVEAVLGGKVSVPTPSGSVIMTVPKWTNTGTVLRLKGKGVPGKDGDRGNEYVTLKVMLPEKHDPKLEEFVSQWSSAGTDGTPTTLEA